MDGHYVNLVGTDEIAYIFIRAY